MSYLFRKFIYPPLRPVWGFLQLNVHKLDNIIQCLFLHDRPHASMVCDHKMNAWIMIPFLWKNRLSYKSKVPCLQENSLLKTHFQDSNLVTVWQKADVEYPVLSNKALELVS